MAEHNTQENKIIVRRVFYELINKKQFSLVEKFFNYKLQLNIGKNYSVGRNNLLAILKKSAIRAPDRHFEIFSIFGEGDMVCAQWILITKLPTEEGLISSPGITVCRFRSGKIVQLDQQWDKTELSSVTKIC